MASIEVGSTNAELVAFADSLDGLRPVSRWTTRTTPAEIRIGVRCLLADAKNVGVGRFPDVRQTSNAAGGLRIAVCGFTPTLSTKIGLEVALGAGGVVVHGVSGRTVERLALYAATHTPVHVRAHGGRRRVPRKR